MFWHAHEMLYGFAQGVIVGFLLTAASNWTGRETLVGYRLGGLALVWLSARVLLLLPLSAPVWQWCTLLLDLSVAPLTALAIAQPIVSARRWRNLGFVVILLGLFAGNLLMHLEAWNALPGGMLVGSRLGLNLTLLAIVLITGRVLPMFTRNATGNEHIRSLPRLEKASFLAVFLVVVVDLLPAPSWLVSAVAAIAATFVLVRTRYWGTLSCARQPLLWILHLGHLWIPMGLLLKAVHGWGSTFGLAWMHALTVGGIGLLTLGMMVRVTLGHTGRMLSPPPSCVVAFVLVSLAALLRVVGPAVLPGWYLNWVAASAVLWSGAFIGFLTGCGPMLLTGRVDGRPG